MNREAELDEINAAAEDLFHDRVRLAVYTFYGIGGVGKTRLLDEYISRWKWKDCDGKNILSISLQSHDYLGVLTEIRRRMPFKADMFDAALISYWDAIGEGGRIDDFLGRVNPSFASRVVGGVSGVPLDLLEETYRRIMRWGGLYGLGNIKEMLSMAYGKKANLSDLDKLVKLLPVFLGDAFRAAHDANHGRFVFAFDRYDNMQINVRGNRRNWLPVFIESCGAGLFVIGSREKLNLKLPAGTVINRRLNVLTEDHAERMLESRGVATLEDRRAIIRMAGGLPLKLELFATCPGAIHSASQQNEAIEDDVVSDILEHAPSDIVDLVPLLAVAGIFNIDVISNIVSEFSISMSYARQTEFIDLSFVERCMASPPFYKIHDELIRPLLRKINAEVAIRSLKVILAYAQRSAIAANHRVALNVFGAVVNSLHLNQLDDIELNEKIIDLAYSLYDAGYWPEMEEAIAFPGLSTGRAAAVTAFARALCSRKLRPAADTLRAFIQVRDHFPKIGRHQLSAKTEEAYVLSLTGEYDAAEMRFRNLFNETGYQKLNRNVRRVRLVFGDILTIRGRFREAMEQFAVLTDSTRSCEYDEVEFAEALRHDGHIHRFNFDFAVAEDRYMAAFGFAKMKRADALSAKLLTNLAETYCWYDPERGLEYADKAISSNRWPTNRIEVGKALAARSIALASLGECDKARDAATEALSVQSSEGYASGILFADLAAYMVAKKSGDQPGAGALRDRIRTRVRTLRVYGFLEVYVAALEHDDDELLALLEKFQWLDGGRIIDGIDILRGRLSSGH
ncbi:MAG: hypothetical protein HQL42_17990 [Alphaproteobacteria bacterium]|nr:hypothetical protein [Alphaproteobacteria bacterium]